MFNLKKLFNEVYHQVSPFDNGKTAATVKASYNKPPPAQTIVQNKINNAKFGVFANNPRAQQQFAQGIDTDEIRRDEYIRKQQRDALAGRINKNLAASRIKATVANDVVKQNTADELLKSSGIGNDLRRGIISGAVNMSPQNIIGSGLKLAGAESAGNRLQSYGNTRDTALDARYANNQGVYQAGNVIGSLVGGLPYMGAGGAANLGKIAKVTTKLAGFGSTGLPVGANTYDQALQMGANEGTARTAGLLTAATTGATNYLPFKGVTSRIGNGVTSNLVNRTLLTGGGNALEEAVANKIAQKTFDPNRSLAQNVPQAFVTGAVAGNVIGAGGDVARKLNDNPEVLSMNRSYEQQARQDPEWAKQDASITKALELASQTRGREKASFEAQAREHQRLRNARLNEIRQGGYVQFPGSEKLSPTDLRTEIKNRLKAESDYFRANEKQIKDADVVGNIQYRQVGRNKIIAENRRLFKEFEKNPDKFIDKYGLMPTTKSAVPQVDKTSKIVAQSDSQRLTPTKSSFASSEAQRILESNGIIESSGITSQKQPKTPTNPTVLEKLPKVPKKSVSSSASVIPQVAEDVSNILKGQKVKERGFAETVRESSKTPKIEAIDNGTYIVKSDKQRITDAREYIKSDPVKAEQVALNPQSDMHVTIGNQLLDHYIATGQMDKFRTLTSGMAESGTELGRAIHAFADYNKTTPSGAVKFAEKTIRQYNKLNPKKQLKLSNDDVKALVTKAQEVQKMPEGRKRNIASQQLMEQVNNLIPSTIADKAITVWKAGLLTSPRTTLRNVLGNAMHGVAEVIKDIPASLNDVLLKQRTGERSLTFTTKGELSGAKKGFGAANDMMKFGFDPTKAIDKYDVRHVTWANTPVQQALKKYTDFVFHALGAQDQPYYQGAYARSLYDQAGAAAKNAGKSGDAKFIKNLVDKPTEKMVINATKDASTATFKNENALRDVAGKFKKTLGKTEAGKIIGEVVAPFTGVPSSVAGQIVAYSPIGLAKGISKDVKVLRKNLPELQRQASQEIGRGVVGSGILGIGAYLTAQGLMTGNPKDAEEARQWELEGKQPNSVLIGGKWRSVNSIGPEALVLLAGSKIQSGVDNSQGTGKIAGNLGKDFTQQTFLQGVQGPLNVISDPDRYGATYSKGQAASVIPNIVKDTAKAFDSTQRETNSVADALKAGIPGLRNDLLPKRDALGNPLKQQPSGVNAYIDLFNSKTPVKNNVINELSRLHSNDQGATPPKLDKKTTIGGLKIELTSKQRNELERRIGGTTNKGFDSFMKTSQYSDLNDEQRKDILDNYRLDVNAVEKQNFAAENNIGPYAPDAPNSKGLTARQQKLVEGKLTIDDYIKKTKTITSKPSTSKLKTTTKKTTAKKATKGKSTKGKAISRKASYRLSDILGSSMAINKSLRQILKEAHL